MSLTPGLVVGGVPPAENVTITRPCPPAMQAQQPIVAAAMFIHQQQAMIGGRQDAAGHGGMTGIVGLNSGDRCIVGGGELPEQNAEISQSTKASPACVRDLIHSAIEKNLQEHDRFTPPARNSSKLHDF